jgi:hypothetical protein
MKRHFGLWPVLVFALWLGACDDDGSGLSGLGEPCAETNDCELGLFCSREGTCYDPTADGDADGDGDSDTDTDTDVDGDTDTDSDSDGGCELADTDGDTIADIHETTDLDRDGDGIPNYLDLDSDGDGIPDEVEAGDDDPCTTPADQDMDGVYSFLDADSDADGLTDTEEAMMGTSPYHEDTDGDGWSDFVEHAAGTRPDDAFEVPAGNVLLFVLPFEDEDGPQNAEFELETTISIADVLFLIDTTHSMSEEIANLRAGLHGIVSSLAELFDDVSMGVARFDDFPVLPYGNAAAGDRVFELVQQVTSEEVLVQAAVDSLVVHSGHDLPESQVPALWHVATGDALGFYLPIAVLDHLVPGTGGIGGVGFRHDAQPIIVLVGDAPMHNDADGANRYDNAALGLETPTYSDALGALTDIGARVVAIAGRDAAPDSNDIAVDTGSVLVDGTPLVYLINDDGTATGGDLSSQVVDGIDDLVMGTPQDVSTSREDDPSDRVDATRFLRAVRPIRADPEAPAGYERHDGATNAYGSFFGVVPGTTVVFDIEAYNDIVDEEESTQVFRLRIVGLGNGVTRLGDLLVVIVVPAELGEIPII